jgi:acetyl-CoA carboxylase beta subunit
MEILEKKYIVDENNKKIAVQLDIKTYNRIEEVLENYSLVQLMKENEDSEILNIDSAKEFYSKLDKAN